MIQQEKKVLILCVANGILGMRGAQLTLACLGDLQKQGSASSSMNHDQGKLILVFYEPLSCEDVTQL